ncbi:MAG TPA: hypothetical protein VIQ54_06270 [Polyangia bacterium]
MSDLRRLHRVFALMLAGAGWGCGPGFALRAPGAPKECGRIAAGPAVVSVFEFDANGGLKKREDWMFDAARNVDAAVAARVKRTGGRTFVAPDVAHTDVAADDFRHWTSATLQEIAGKIAGTKSSPHQSVGDWRFEQSLTTWRAALGADFALALLFVDAYEPAAASNASSTSTTSRYDAAQTGIACLVDLNDSRVVACGTSPRRFGDLRTGDSARDAVDDVVGRICP